MNRYVKAVVYAVGGAVALIAPGGILVAMIVGGIMEYRQGRGARERIEFRNVESGLKDIAEG